LAYKPVPTYPLELALKYAAFIIREQGYTSKKDAQITGGSSTSDILNTWFTASACRGTLQEDSEKAQEALVWLQGKANITGYASESDFDRSMRMLTIGGYRNVAPGMITKSDFGFVACVYSTMERAAGREKNKEVVKEAASTSEYIGKLKSRAEFFVKLVGKKYSDNIGCYIYNVKDQKGNLGVFFSSDADLAKLEDCFLAKMTPKRHSVNNYHGGKETVFNRVKVVQNVGALKPTQVVCMGKVIAPNTTDNPLPLVPIIRD